MPKISWQEVDDALVADITFADFKGAFRFMTIVAELAEAQGHHPDWRNVYNRVWVTLTTHDAGNTVTEMDRRLAKAISEHSEIRNIPSE